jgi:hypothetical protein
VNKFIELCGGKSLLVGMTTTEVNNEHSCHKYLRTRHHTVVCLIDGSKHNKKSLLQERVTIDTMCTCEDVDRMENKLCAW